MRSCTVVNDLQIVEGDIADYQSLAAFHYRDGKLGPWCRIFAIRPGIGVIVYKMPVTGCQLRNIALGRILSPLGKAERMSFINSSIRCISRVIIEPRYRGLGLASRLVSQTMGLVAAPIIEAMAVIGQVNPFFQKAGMTPYYGPQLARCQQIKEAMSLVGIQEKDLVDTEAVQDKIQRLANIDRKFIDRQMVEFLQCYGKRRQMAEGIDRTRFLLSKMTDRPVYYIKLTPSGASCRFEINDY
jgi:hypothetical protein